MAENKPTGNSEITTDEDCMHKAQDVQGSLNDMINEVDDKDYVQALEELDDLQEDINAIHVYLTTKAKE